MMATTAPSRWLDSAGHSWPITGTWCALCGLPLVAVEPGQRAHPCCEDSPLDVATDVATDTHEEQDQ